MEHAVLQHLLEEGAEQVVGELLAGGGLAVGPDHVAHAGPVDPLHHQHPRGRERVVDLRHVDARVGGQAGGDRVRVARLDPEVELLAQPATELTHQVAHVVLGTPRRAGLDDLAELLEHREVDLDLLVEARALHLHDHRRAVGQLRAVHLTDRRRRDRLPVERDERLVDRAVQLFFEQRRDRVAVGRPHVVLEPRQLTDRVGREQVGAGRQDLAELDEHPAALLEREPQAAHRREPLAVEIVLRAEAERRPQPVAGGDAGDLGVATDAATAALERPDRVRDGLQAGLGARERARTGEELDPHPRRHRPEQREEEQVAPEVSGRIRLVVGDEH